MDILCLGVAGGRPCLSTESRRTLVADLGWEPLRCRAITSAVMLRQRMRLDPLSFEHARYSHQVSPAPGTWLAFVVSLQYTYDIPEIDLDEADIAEMPRSTLRRRLAAYRHGVVYPAVLRGSGYAGESRSLPWGWITFNLAAPAEASSFRHWWYWRVVGVPMASSGGPCSACGDPEGPTAEHIAERCAPAAIFAESLRLEGGRKAIFAAPISPTGFRSQMQLARILASDVSASPCS